MWGQLTIASRVTGEEPKGTEHGELALGDSHPASTHGSREEREGGVEVCMKKVRTRNSCSAVANGRRERSK